MTSSPDILWLGAHKTGTTFLQACLEASRPALETAGIHYPALEPFRAAWTRPLLNAGWEEPPAPAGRPDAGRLLVFDENIPALVQAALGPEGLYPEAGARAGRVADHLELERPRLVLGVRSFADYLPSLYCEALKSTPFRRFRRFLTTPTEALSWTDLALRLLSAFPGSDLVVYRAEDLRGRETGLIETLLDLPAGAVTLAGTGERPGFSHEAVARLHVLSRQRDAAKAAGGRGGIDRAEQRALIAAHPRGPGAPGFDPWTADERAALEAAYAADWARLTGLPGVRVLAGR